MIDEVDIWPYEPGHIDFAERDAFMRLTISTSTLSTCGDATLVVWFNGYMSIDVYYRHRDTP